MQYAMYFYLFFIGISIGSYINNIAYRINNNMKTMSHWLSIKKSDTPKYSECPICNNKLKSWMNIPIFSWIYLRGKCYFCKSHIPFLYVFSEFTFGVIFIFIYFVNQNIYESIAIFTIYFTTYLNLSIYFIEKSKFKNKILLFLNLLFVLIYILFIIIKLNIFTV